MSTERSAACLPRREPRWAGFRSRSAWALVLLAFSLFGPRSVFGQAGQDTTGTTKNPTAKRWGWKFHYPNEIETPFMTLRLGGAVLMDYAWYEQNNKAREQRAIDTAPTTPDAIERPYVPALSLATTSEVRARAVQAQQELAPELDPAFKFRDTRFLLRGRINTRHPTIWQAGIMWDGVNREWLIRQTGIMTEIPAIRGHLWIGRTKEGTSLNRVMVGYDGWTMERFMFSDASIPLLADGVKWLGYLPKQHLLWNLGVFADPLSKGQTFSYYERQAAARIAYVRIDADTLDRLLHVGLALRVGRPTDDTLQLKSKPESTTAPNFVDTGKFPAKSSGLVGLEAYYRPGNWLFGGEYYLQKVDSPETGDPLFHGGEIVTSWLITGERRPYTTAGGYFRAVSPKNSLNDGGSGALELVLRLSYIDLTSGTLEGGSFWRLTPMFNWHLSDNIRFEFGYGYGVLNRFGLKGVTQFFQTRLQTQL